jgi:catechol 2,3-dioxygenase
MTGGYYVTEYQEPIHDIAQLGHFEIFTPKPDESLWFFREILGMEETDRQGQSVYLRAWGDYGRSTLKLTEAKQAGLGHIGWRAWSPQALDRRVQALEAAGSGKGWIEGDLGHGRAYQFTDPDGHLMEVYYEAQKYQAPPGLHPYLINQPQKFTGRGASVKRIDHVNLMCSNVTPNHEFLQSTLGFRLRERLQPEEGGIEEGAWLSVTPLVHDIAYTRDFSGNRGRLHHIAYWLDSREEVLRTADIVMDNNVFLEAGPSRHNITQAFYLYLYEPGGNRVEICSSSYLIFNPDWEPITWRKTDRGRGVYWGGTLPESFKTYGTPVIDTSTEKKEDLFVFDPA